MTRQEFLDNHTSLGDLMSFCYEYNLSACEDLYDVYSINDEIMHIVDDYTNWEDLREFLDSIPTHCDYFQIVDGQVYNADDMFEDYLQYVLNEAYDRDIFDLEEEELIDDEELPPYAVPEELAEEEESEIVFEADVFSTLLSYA